MTQPLSDEAREVIAQEEALLARVHTALVAAAQQRAEQRHAPELVERLKELREEATTATVSDLPALFQEMSSVRALAEKDERKPLPPTNTPYFAHLRLRNEQGSRDFLLGRATYIDTSAGVRVVDWRFAPVARIFYAYQEGDEYEEQLPGGVSEGVVEARRVVVIERGVLTRVVAGRLVLVRRADGTWVDEGDDPAAVLAGGEGSAARPGCLGVGRGAYGRAGAADITALLDQEQYEAMNADADRPLLVIGSAGSGKTTVALHRLAKLAFEQPQRFQEARTNVIVPEEGLARLSRRLLEPLGLRRVRVETLGAWLYRAACETFGMRSIKVCADSPALVARLKRHPALHRLLFARLGRLSSASLTFQRLRKRLAMILSDHSFLAEVVMASGGDLPRTVIEKTARHTMAQLAATAAREYEGFDPESLKTADGKAIDEDTPAELAGSVDLEDLALFMCLQARGGVLRAADVAHLVLDEAEDFSLFELEVLGALLGRKKSCTLAGDEMQRTQASFGGWDDSLRALGAKGAATCRLQVSYRCPRPVAALAQQVLGPLAPAAPARPGREGAPVGRFHFPDEAQAQLFLSNALRDLQDREPNASVGIVASTADAARQLYGAFAGLPHVRLVVGGEFSFEPGVDVTHVGAVKGLEFDYVVVADASADAYPQDDEARRRLHVAVTRASHQLWVVSSGRPSPLLPAC